MEEDEKRLAEELLFSEKKRPSFAKQLFFGKFDSSQVFPFPYPPKKDREQIEAFLSKVKHFAEKEIDPVKIDKEAKIPDKVIKGLADLGVLGMTVPKKYGGLNMSQYAYCRTTEEISRRCGSTALYVNVHQSIGLKSILLFGTEMQKEKWLPILARGEETAAFSLTEPNAGSDANGIETRAVYDPVKKIYRINGQKQWTTNGGIAKVLTVMVKTPVQIATGSEDKVTAFLVTPDMPGFKVKDRSLDKVGMRGTWTANLEFKDLEVPEENVLGPFGKGLKVCLTVLDFGRTTFGSTCTGTAKELVERAIHHAVNRHQFKRPLASFGLVKKKIAMMSALVYAMEASTYLTAGFIDNHQEDFMLETAILKVFTSDSQWQILYDTMQILGGRSFFTDEPYERMMRDARLNMIGEGSNEVLRAFIGAVGLRDVGMELKEASDAFGHFFKDFGKISKAAGSLISRLNAPEVPVQSSLLNKEANMLSSIIKRFSFTCIKLLARYGEDILEHQLQLDRLSSVVMSIYTMTAVISKLDWDIAHEKNNENKLRHDLEIGKFYCHFAMTMADRLLKATSQNNDDIVENLSDLITGLKRR